MIKAPDFDVAISFAGEQRTEARSLALKLEDAGYSVFFDEFESAQLWGEELTVYLHDVYSNRARYCLILVSKEWVDKAWTNHERKAALSRALNERGGYILPLTVDGAHIPGYSDVHAYKDLRSLNLDGVFGLLTQKLGRPAARTPNTRLLKADVEAVQEVLQACFRRAVFTRMASEISLDAMHHSLGDAIHRLQLVIPRIKNPAAQHATNTILMHLDEAQRMTPPQRGFTCTSLDPEGRRAIDYHKELVLQQMRELKRMSGLNMQFPFSLAVDHFFTPEDGSEPPHDR